MKEIAAKLLNDPFNWTNLSFIELVNGGRIPSSMVDEKLKELGQNYLNTKYEGQDPDIREYLDEKKELETALKSEFANIMRGSFL